MLELLGRGYCGGHVTLMFTIEDSDPDPINQGSRGVGICLEDGVEIICRGREGKGNLDVFFTDHIGDSRLYIDCLNLLSVGVPEVMEYDWEATVKLGLPTGQGFGMSAAGSVSFCNSIQRAIGIPYEEGHRRSLMIAHLVDRKRSSGLGDVTALSAGGVEIRKIPGSPFNKSISKPESSEIQIRFVFFEKYEAFINEFSSNVFPVSGGVKILNFFGEYFFTFFGNKSHISLYFP